MQVLVRLCGLLSLTAAALHAGLVGEHLREWWGYGGFFIIASLAQGVYGLVLLALPGRPNWDPAHWRAWRMRLYSAGLVGNGLVLVLYTITRTVGVPFGPAAGQIEPVESLGLLTKAVELVTVAGLAVLLQQARTEGSRQGLPSAQV